VDEYEAVTITAGFNKLSGYSAGETPGATSALVTGSVASQTASLTKLTGTKSRGSVTGTATGSAAYDREVSPATASALVHVAAVMPSKS
jgi:hypothetical protein